MNYNKWSNNSFIYEEFLPVQSNTKMFTNVITFQVVDTSNK